jgi:hypothetical protein
MVGVSGPEEVDRNGFVNSNGNNKNHFAKLQFLKSMSVSHVNPYESEGEQERRSSEARPVETDRTESRATDLREPAGENSGGMEDVTSHTETEASSEKTDRTASGGTADELPAVGKGPEIGEGKGSPGTWKKGEQEQEPSSW